MTFHAELALFVLVCANQAGIPVPGGMSLVGAGALAASGILSFPLVVAVGIGGTLVADLVWFSLGRWRGAQALGVLGRISRRARTYVLRAQGFLMAHRLRFLLSARFLPEMNPVAAGLAGAAGVRVVPYFSAAAGSALIWTGTWAGLGYLLSGVFARIAAHAGFSLLLAIAGALAGYVTFAYARGGTSSEGVDGAGTGVAEPKVRLDRGDREDRLSGVDGGTIARRPSGTPATLLAALAWPRRLCHDRQGPSEFGRGARLDRLAVATAPEGRGAADLRGLVGGEGPSGVDDDRRLEQPVLSGPSAIGGTSRTP
jgi:membrane protein DedA with SNARE-associated domain